MRQRIVDGGAGRGFLQFLQLNTKFRDFIHLINLKFIEFNLKVLELTPRSLDGQNSSLQVKTILWKIKIMTIILYYHIIINDDGDILQFIQADSANADMIEEAKEIFSLFDKVNIWEIWRICWNVKIWEI